MGDESIEAFFRSVYPTMVAQLSHQLGPAAQAEDVVQEALVRAWQHERSGDHITSLPSWVRVVASNLGRDHIRGAASLERAHRRWAAEPPTAARPAAAILDEGLCDVVASLPPRQREVVLLHYGDDMAVDRIAAELGISAGTVKATLARARRAMARILRPDEVNDVKEWILAGSHPADYEVGVEEGERLDGHRIAFLRAKVDEPAGFGTLMQMIGAQEVKGQRVRFSAMARSTEIAEWAGLWMRVDGAGRRSPLAFDNMQARPMKGTGGWTHHEVVLDVAEEAAAVGLGVLLNGMGAVHISRLAFEVVDESVAVTEPGRPVFPQNLDFEE